MSKNNITIGAIVVILLVGSFVYLKNKQYALGPQVEDIATSDNINSETNTSDNTQNMEIKNLRQYMYPGVLPPDRIKDKQAVISTKNGEIIIKLLSDDAPATVSNLIYLAEQEFYDGLTFHRVVPDFVAQGGDPSGNGTGGPGYQFPDEPVHKNYTRGIVAMANAGPDTNGSQFFIVLKDQPTLAKNYTIFGEVVSGMDIVDKIVIGDKMLRVVIK